ncbi:MAG: hypothetical protein ACI9GW_001242 [Halieaceae bacterium]|jgi:hypothetical protein
MLSRRYIPNHLLVLALVLATHSNVGLAADKAEIYLLILEVKEKQEAVRRQEHAWTVTDDYVEEALKALEENDLQAAMAAAKRAVKTVSASLQQAEDESLAWRTRQP